jgi:NAD-dependent deacetylase
VKVVSLLLEITGGLWDKYKVEDVATIEARNRDPETVLDFYNLRRKEMIDIQPNQSHFLISKLTQNFNVTVVTQNIDDLHEKQVLKMLFIYMVKFQK